MVVDLESQRLEALLEGWSTLLDRLASLPAEDRPAAPVPIASVAGQRIVKVYRRMVKEGRAIDPHGPSGPFHELRKRGKELRYLLELFGAPLYPDDVVRPMIKTLKALQNVLGRHQDREVQIATLSSLAGELADDRSALLATGALIASLEDDKRVARAEFAERFQVFSRKEQRALVRDTFA
jgi:CHAD domain-containing protein